MARDEKDYAIEFGEYLAKAAERYVEAIIASDMAAETALIDFDDEKQDAAMQAAGEAGSALVRAVYEFRKRAAHAGHEPSALEFRK